jgi:hypothetical protein
MKVSFLPKAQKEIEAEIAAKVAQLGTGFHKIEPNVPALAVVCALFPKEVTKHLVAANATAGGGITSKDRAKRLEALDL